MIQMIRVNQSPEELVKFNPGDFAEHSLERRTHLREEEYLQKLLNFCREFPSYQLVYFDPDSSIKDRLIIRGVERKHTTMAGDEIDLQMKAGFEMLFTNRHITDNCLWLQDSSTWRLYPVYDFQGGVDGERFCRLWSDRILEIRDIVYVQPGDILVKKVTLDGQPAYTYQAIFHSKGDKVLVLLSSEKTKDLQVREISLDSSCRIFRPFYKL